MGNTKGKFEDAFETQLSVQLDGQQAKGDGSRTGSFDAEGQNSRDSYLQSRNQQFSALEYVLPSDVTLFRTNLYVQCNHFKRDGKLLIIAC